MVWAGAKEQTADEMKKVLHLSLEPERQHALNHKRIYDWNGSNAKDRSYQLSVANSLWGQKDEPWNPDFVKLMDARYAAGLHQVDFDAGLIGRWREYWDSETPKRQLAPS